MDEQKIDYNKVKEPIDIMTSVATSFQATISNLDKIIGNLPNSAWEGSAAEEVSPVLYKLKEDIAMLQSACAEFSENVETSVMNYQEADASSIKTVQDIIQG